MRNRMMGMTPTEWWERGDGLAMSFGWGWSQEHYENNKPW